MSPAQRSTPVAAHVGRCTCAGLVNGLQQQAALLVAYSLGLYILRAKQHSRCTKHVRTWHIGHLHSMLLHNHCLLAYPSPSGNFPRWVTTSGDLPIKNLYLDGNAGLTGCVPAFGDTRVTYAGTQMAGRCHADPSQQHKAQAVAMRSAGALLFCQGLLTAAYDKMLNELFDQTDLLGKVVDKGQSHGQLYSAAIIEDYWGPSITVDVDVVDGIEYITSIFMRDGALNLTQLPMLAQELPWLKVFNCDWCMFSTTTKAKRPIGAADLILPSGLPAAAPRLELLWIVSSGLVGRLPDDFGEWHSLNILNLGFNQLTGVRVHQWAMPCLRGSMLTAQLPCPWMCTAVQAMLWPCSPSGRGTAVRVLTACCFFEGKHNHTQGCLSQCASLCIWTRLVALLC